MVHSPPASCQLVFQLSVSNPKAQFISVAHMASLQAVFCLVSPLSAVTLQTLRTIRALSFERRDISSQELGCTNPDTVTGNDPALRAPIVLTNSVPIIPSFYRNQSPELTPNAMMYNIPVTGILQCGVIICQRTFTLNRNWPEDMNEKHVV